MVKKILSGIAALPLLILPACSILSQVTSSGTGGISARFVLVSGGTFTMGSPANEPERESDEGPQHQVTVSSFYMGKYEVTQQEYEAVMGTNPSVFKGPNAPVGMVTWYNAIEYCNKLSEREGLTPVYTISKDRRDPNNLSSDPDEVKWTVTWERSANGYRLPTEAEWEYACRAGTTTAYYTGNTMGVNDVWYSANKVNNPPPEVGKKPANPCGLYDIQGNVLEWCWDWKGNYSSGAQTDPVGASSGASRIFRGGGGQAALNTLRSAYRDSGVPVLTRTALGFRIVRSVL